MRSRRAICVSRDRHLRDAVEPALASAGVAVEHCDDVPGDTRGAVLVVIDRATRQAAGDGLGAIAAPVVIVGDDLDDDGVIAAMLDGPVSHLVADPSDRDLGITSTKLASGDLFGLEKYLEFGPGLGPGLGPDLGPGLSAAVAERTVTGDPDKRAAIGAVCAWAEAIGARRPLVHRLASVVDELLMNALYDTPASGASRAALRWGADDRAIAISVGDGFGALRQRDVIDHVRRARRERGRPRSEAGAGRGAGIGLYLVLGNVASLVVNVEAGKRTEVVCLFDRTTPGRPAAAWARSLHVFRSAAP
jgi:anti-sigma regulatory factor (Ser/Thr protein kinase)